MASAYSDQPGGFLEPTLLGPPPPSNATTTGNGLLPHPRSSPLKAGGSKESALIRYVDQGLLHIQRRFAKREFLGVAANDYGSGSQPKAGTVRPGVLAIDQDDGVVGYSDFGEAARDIESLVDVIWISGTPSIQIPYLLNLALLVSSFLPDLPAAPRPMFRLLSKLDMVFASLLQGRNLESGEDLPGFSGFGGRGISGTEKVRIKSIVDRTRICVVDALNRGNVEDGGAGNSMDAGTETEDDPDDFNVAATTDEDMDRDSAPGVQEVQGDWDMLIARVYEKTVVELGDALGGAPIGIISDP